MNTKIKSGEKVLPDKIPELNLSHSDNKSGSQSRRKFIGEAAHVTIKSAR